MEEKEIKSDKNFMKVIAVFLLFFAILVFISAALSATYEGIITNLACGIVLASISGAFYMGYKKKSE